MIELLDEAFDKKSWHGPNLRSDASGGNYNPKTFHLIRGAAAHGD